QGHDHDDQAQAEHQLVANPPVRGHSRPPWAASVRPAAAPPAQFPIGPAWGPRGDANGRTLPKALREMEAKLTQSRRALDTARTGPPAHPRSGVPAALLESVMNDESVAGSPREPNP